MNPIKQLVRVARSYTIYSRRTLHRTPCRLSFIDCSPNSHLDKSVTERFMCLPIPEPKTQVSYVWIDGTGLDLRLRSRTLDFVPSTYKDCPNWSFDGSSTYFSSPEKSDCYIVPIAMYADPFRRGNNKIVMCETFTYDKKPTKTNHRQACIEILNKVCDQEVMFGFEQEMYLTNPDGKPFGWPCDATPNQNNEGYASVGAHRVIGREVIECLYRCCLYAGIDIYGSTGERGMSQWEVLTGPTMSIKAADDLWMVRLFAHLVAEAFGIAVSFKPTVVEKGVPSGLHTTMSTKKTRDEGGIKYIHEMIGKLEKNHETDLKFFDCAEGTHLKERLTGHHHTCNVDKFKVGVGDRTACIRISPAVSDKKKGFFEDRRPSSCADPYNVVTALITSCFCS